MRVIRLPSYVSKRILFIELRILIRGFSVDSRTFSLFLVSVFRWVSQPSWRGYESAKHLGNPLGRTRSEKAIKNLRGRAGLSGWYIVPLEHPLGIAASN